MARRVVSSFRCPAISCVRVALSMTHGPAISNSGRALPISWPASCMGAARPRSGAGRLRQLGGALGARGADETGEQRMPVARGGGELGVELRGHEPRVVGQLNHLHQTVAREAGKAQPCLAVALEVVVVELEAVAVAL